MRQICYRKDGMREEKIKIKSKKRIKSKIRSKIRIAWPD
jgi:hypothetical protein